MAKVNSRSPYYINISDSGLESAIIRIWIYSGTQTTDRDTNNPNYTMTSNAINEKISVDISGFVKDYVNINFDGTYSTDNYWVDYEITKTINGVSPVPTLVENRGFYGYGYFEDGLNPQNDSGLLQSNTNIIKLDDAPAVIPVDTEITNQVTFELDGDQVYTKAISDSEESDEQIEYVTSGVNGADQFENRVIQDGGTFEGSACLEEFTDEFELFDFDTIYVETDDEVIKLNVTNVSECKYEPIKLTFTNKFGALQDIWFFKTNKITMNTKRQSYRPNIISSQDYLTSYHQYSNLMTTGRESITINSGFYPESYNEIFKQMMLSNEVWIEFGNKTLPVTIESNSMQFKTSLNDNLIQYSLNLKFAYDKINSVT